MPQQPSDTTFISHAHEGATREALGYARGHADASGTPTAGRLLWVNPDLAFARAWANSRENAKYTPDLRSAYEAWQYTGGCSIEAPE